MKYKVDYKKCHEAMWMWLHKHPTRKCGGVDVFNKKEDWPGHRTIYMLIRKEMLSNIPKISHYLSYHCFACQETYSMKETFPDCFKCKVYFEMDSCETPYSLYILWLHSLTKKDKAKYALMIAKGWRKE